jgi:hypothetical protein
MKLNKIAVLYFVILQILISKYSRVNINGMDFYGVLQCGKRYKMKTLFLLLSILTTAVLQLRSTIPL